jgi:hypothetical protein
VVSPEDISVTGLAIPDSAVAGKLRGQEFASNSAILENGVLKLRQGSSTPPEAELTISLPSGESLAGKSWDTSKSQERLPQIQFSIKSPKRNGRMKRSYTGGYGLRLEFGAERDGKIAGKIYARFPDVDKSYVAGTFTAEIVNSKPPATAVIRG